MVAGCWSLRSPVSSLQPGTGDRRLKTELLARSHGHVSVAALVEAPRALGPGAGVVDVDARRAADALALTGAKKKLGAAQIDAVVRCIEPEGGAHPAGTAGDRAQPLTHTSTRHQELVGRQRLDRSNQHCVRFSLA